MMIGKINSRGRHPEMLLIPVVAFYVAFWLRPTFRVVVESFTDASGRFTFGNYTRLLVMPEIRDAFINTIVFTLGSTVLQFFFAVGLALFLNRKFKFSNLVLFITLIPMAFPPAAVGILWKTGLYRFGWLNSFLSMIGLIDPANPVDWMSLRNMQAAMFLIVVDTWTVLPSVMIIILAGLQNFNKEFEEAGWVFGANRFQTIRDIVLPIMKPTIVTAMILRLIAAIQVWLIAVMIFGYNIVPLLVERIAYNIDVITFGEFAKKDAYTLSVMVVVIVIASTLLYLKASKNSADRAEENER
jgi:multiple sugar transport system permease protein